MQSLSKGEQPSSVNPPHYKHYDMECVDIMKAMSTKEEFIGYLRLTAFKYQYRYQHKGKAKEDLDKSIWFLNKLKEELHD